MRTILRNEEVLKTCKIYQMLAAQTDKPHLSFHTPGHKTAGWDITELVYSDNLSCPRGCIAEAEADIAQILGAEKSFILTDGSTSGVLSMLYAAKSLGVKSIAVCEGSHKSVWNGCKLLGITPLVYPRAYKENIPYAPTMSELNDAYLDIFRQADALFFTSPDYYGNCADLIGATQYCYLEKKLLLVDCAHGGHLHMDVLRHPRFHADMWVDGVHKSLPAFTQGAVVSANNGCSAALAKAVDIFRTTSPSYPIMASVEYAVKYPRNKELEIEVALYKSHSRIYDNGDWTKFCTLFGKNAFEAEKELQQEGIYPEFCDGNILMFYLSPATEIKDFKRLQERLEKLFEKYPYVEEKRLERIPAPLVSVKNKETERVEAEAAEGRICAGMCGLFPPCTPLLLAGERIEKRHIELLKSADNVFGLRENKILVLKEEKGE